MTTQSFTVTIPGALFGATITVAPPDPPPPAPLAGTQAFRIADLLERFGVNCFSQHDVSWNPWGAWPIEYTAATTIAALKEIIGTSGYTINVRAFYYAGRETVAGGGDLIDWCPAVNAATGAKISLAIGQGGTNTDAAALATWLGSTTPAWLGWLEGVNEPNGVAPVALPITEAAQADLPTATGAVIMGPSIVIGMPHSEGWVTDYLGAGGAANILAHATAINVHYYPSTLPSLDDGTGRAGEIDDVFQGERMGWASQAPQIITEFHTTYYNSAGRFAGGAALDSYYLPIFMLEAYRLGFEGYFWFSLFDFGTTPCGLIAQTAGNPTVLTPRAPAVTLANLFAICGPGTATKHTFAPGSLAFTASGLPAPINSASPNTGGQTMLFQRDDGAFLLFVWNAQVAPGGTATPVTIVLPTSPSKVEHFMPATGAAALATWTGQSSVTVSLAADFHVLRITP